MNNLTLTGHQAHVSVASTTVGSLVHIGAAQRYAQRAIDLDDPAKSAAGSEARKRQVEDLVDAALSAVLTSCAAVEASVNELFIERKLYARGMWFPQLRDDIAKAFASEWQTVDMYELKTKCQIATAIAGKPRIDFGCGSSQKMSALIDLRNTLIHHKPITVEQGKPVSESDDWIEKRLHKHFEASRLCFDYAFRWNKCLGSGCARWAYETALDFQRHFFVLLETDYPRLAP